MSYGHLDYKPESENCDLDLKSKLAGMTKKEKLAFMDELLLDTYISALNNGSLKSNDLGAVVTYLKNNKQIEEVKEETVSDEIDKILDEAEKERNK